METTMTKVESGTFIRRLRFPPEVERAFQESYYFRMRPTLRSSIFMLAGLSVLVALLHAMSDTGFVFTHAKVFVFIGTAFINLLLVGLAFRRGFEQFWQPSVVATTLFSLATLLIKSSYSAVPFVALYLLLIVSRIQRLQLRWMALQLLGVLSVGAIAIIADAPGRGHWDWEALTGILLLYLVLMPVPILTTLKSERFERREFLTKYLLAQERNDERNKREQTERMLHILSQAIGGIVHDLGNPLTAVQGGAETLLYFLKEGEPDKDVIQEFAEMITDGAQMLNYLRLSLMEQTRVLEGKPVPVELTPTSIHHLVKAGAHYQKPRFANGRNISFKGDELQICVDEMRFITIFMNLIGNALKYSDGEVCITWHTQENLVLIAVQDQGNSGQGISQTQAEKLFVPFGRLDTHAQIEGTGLGLLSVRKIAEAHDGEVYIEGHTDGTSTSAIFSTAQNTYPALLEDGFRTAFVTACPLKIMPQEVEKSAPPIEAAADNN
ncbi:alkaline phosphatase synthesis sensor protein PhoR [Abditibacteriota bacterium]|nr:alkaline phosphatase synthesis sensor protein PhoR [Abditibacteriota bacterium]